MDDNIEKEAQISYEYLENAVINAINRNDYSFLDIAKNENQLKYMQKFAETLISNKNTEISVKSLLITVAGLGIGIIAVGTAFMLLSISLDLPTKIEYFIGGFFLVCLGVWIMFKYKNKPIIKREEEIRVINNIIIDIERRILDKD